MGPKENGKNVAANLMRKMGWSDGQGLGKNSQGMTRNIQAKVKNNNYGIGCSVKDGKDWVAGQDDFNAVLRMLNDDDTSAFEQEKRKQKRAIQKKAMHAKFVKAKDLSTKTESDMKALFGSAGGDIFSQLKATGTAAEKKPKKEEKTSDSSSDSETDDKTINKSEPTVMDVEKSVNMNTRTSSLSCGDYFAKMMAKRGIKNPYAPQKPDLKKMEEIVVKAEAELAEENKKDKKKKKKHKRKLEVEEEIKEEVVAEEELVEAPKKKKKKKNKNKSQEPEETVESPEPEPEPE